MILTFTKIVIISISCYFSVINYYFLCGKYIDAAVWIYADSKLINRKIRAEAKALARIL